ncbi:hypothetical protein GCM10023322_53180 [Rugosimonospora acidiphila]|uniref:DUF2171 domain-containing protein n=1 Tax=Rugosimonospora acidiphila TaxID=556531 RepID=A0ABP9S8N1_9ACTN
MQDPGPPIAYLALRGGTPVYDRAGNRVGTMEHVLADERSDIFHGLIIDAAPPLPRHAFADADQIAELHEQAVLLSVEGGELHALNERTGAGEASIEEGKLRARLEEAREWVGRHH